MSHARARIDYTSVSLVIIIQVTNNFMKTYYVMKGADDIISTSIHSLQEWWGHLPSE